MGLKTQLRLRVTQTDEPFNFIDAAGQPIHRTPDAVRPGAGAVIFNGAGEVLLELRADYGLWGLPGGGVDVGEAVEQAVKREVLEETGLEVRIKRLIGVYSDPRRYCILKYPNGDVVQHVTTLFECERVGGDLRFSDESTDLRYFDGAKLPENTLVAHRVRIEDALANRVTPFIR